MWLNLSCGLIYFGQGGVIHVDAHTGYDPQTQKPSTYKSRLIIIGKQDVMVEQTPEEIAALMRRGLQ